MRKTKNREGRVNSTFITLMNEINILKRNVHLLRIIKREEPIGIHRLSNISHYPIHQVRYSLKVLEEKQIIKPTAKGAVLVPSDENHFHTLQSAVEKVQEELSNINNDLEGYGEK